VLEEELEVLEEALRASGCSSGSGLTNGDFSLSASPKGLVSDDLLVIGCLSSPLLAIPLPLPAVDSAAY